MTDTSLLQNTKFILKNIPGHIYWLNRDNVYMGCNIAQAKSYGLASPLDIVGKRNRDFTQFYATAEETEKVDEVNELVMSSCREQIFEETVIQPNGDLKYFISHKKPLFNEHNKVIGLLGISTNIIDIKEREKVAHHTQQQLEMILNNIIYSLPGHLYWKDVNGIYVGCNDAQARSLGLNNGQEVIGKTDFELTWAAGDAKKFRENDLKVMNNRKAITMEESAIFNGKPSIVLSQKFPLKNDTEEVFGILGISLDITEQKNTEAALKAAHEREAEIRRAITILTGSMAHDLRNPLVVARMMSTSMKKYFDSLVAGYRSARAENLTGVEELTDFQIDYLAKIPDKLLELIDQMNTFIDDDLKTVSHAVSGSTSREDLVECRINSCITKAINSYPFEGNDKALVEWQSGGDFVFKGNSVLLYRIIFNLLKNALYQIKKHNKGKIHITTELKEDVNILRFKDTAGDVTNEAISNLFDGFNTTKQEGTGIGLAFCKLTMQSFSGDINCQVVENDCIEFMLNFPKI
ncbi:MAG: PAS domain-containing protein [Gammaproteobacteria bacterium]|nr:PAS domain-containing protein [Gammaproteobacteria bacterium]